MAVEAPAPVEVADDVAPAASKKRIDRHTLALRIVALAAEADEPITGPKIADAFGLHRSSASIKRATELAREEGWLRLENGRGFVLGDASL